MKVAIFVFMFINLSLATNLISLNEIKILFRKLMLNQLTGEDHVELRDVFDILRRPEPVSVTPLTEGSDVRRRIECILCRSILFAFLESITNGKTDEEITDTVTVICTNLGIFTHSVCHGAAALNVPILSYIFKTTPGASADTMCSLILQTASYPQACPSDEDPRFEWHVELPQKPSTIPVPINDEKPLKVAIITDAHIDPLYEPFGVADCNEPTCCRIGQSPAKNPPTYKYRGSDLLLKESLVNVEGTQMLNLSLAQKRRNLDKKVPNKVLRSPKVEPAGYWGDYRNCDSPIWAFDDAVEHIKENHEDIDILYYIGDTIDHGIWETSYELINEMNQYLIEKIRDTLGNNVMVVPVIANHESQPTNQFAPSSITAPKLNTTWLYNSLADKWSPYLTEQAKTSLRKSGDFSLLVRPGLRVISLNNNVAYKYNWWLMYDPLDAKNHLDWLVQELYNAELKGEKVHILAHIPPGTSDLTYTWTREYNRIVNRFFSTIAAEFNGHTHRDEFKIFYSPEGTPINVAWGGGGVVTYSFYNLNYKIVDLHPQTYLPVRIQNYIYNLTEANLTPGKRPRWFLLYDMNSMFEISDLSPKSMNDLVYSMVTDRRQLLDIYAAFNSKLSDILWPQCDDTCKLNILCGTVITVLWDRRKCSELVKLFYL